MTFKVIDNQYGRLS